MTSAAVVKSQIDGIVRVMDAKRDEIQKAIPVGLHTSVTYERLRSLTQLALAKNPQIAECTPSSILLSVMEAARLGLEVGSPRGVYLVPYGKQCQPITAAWGLAELILRAGDVVRIITRCVYEGDEFEIAYGLQEKLHHVPASRTEPGALVAVYALFHFREGPPQYEWMWRADVDRIRKRSRAGNNGPWVTDYDAMAEKTVLRRLAKRVRQTPEIEAALELDNRLEGTTGAASEILDVDPDGNLIVDEEQEKPKRSRARATDGGNNALRRALSVSGEVEPKESDDDLLAADREIANMEGQE